MLLEEPVYALFQLHAQAVPAGEHALQAGKVKIVYIVQPEQRLVKRGYAGNKVWLVLFEQLRICLWRKARHQYAAAAVDQHGMYAHAQAEAVEHGHDGKHLIARLEHWVSGNYLHAERVEIEV